MGATTIKIKDNWESLIKYTGIMNGLIMQQKWLNKISINSFTKLKHFISQVKYVCVFSLIETCLMCACPSCRRMRHNFYRANATKPVTHVRCPGGSTSAILFVGFELNKGLLHLNMLPTCKSQHSLGKKVKTQYIFNAFDWVYSVSWNGLLLFLKYILLGKAYLKRTFVF